MSPLLSVKNLSVDYWRGKKRIPALAEVSFDLEECETLGIVGESGSGKSTLMLALLRLLTPPESRVTNGKIFWKGRDLNPLSQEEIRNLRGNEIGIVFQDPFSSLNPVLRIGKQIEESIAVHAPDSKNKLKEKTLSLLQSVRFEECERIYGSYPHQISGGQMQRVLIAMAIANHPKLLIGDEPTTALDVTIQKEILDLLLNLKSELNMSILLVTHHLGVAAHYSDRILVLREGKILESGKTESILKNPQHLYTQSLIQSLHSIHRPRRKSCP